MYEFLKTGAVSPDDVQELVRLTEGGHLCWVAADDMEALSARPTAATAIQTQVDCEALIGRNLMGIRVGCPSGYWSYLRLTDGQGQKYYVERQGLTAELKSPLDWLYTKAQKAVRLGGRLGHADITQACHRCGRHTGHVALCNRPHGLPGAIMADSQRLVCVVCETATPLQLVGTA